MAIKRLVILASGRGSNFAAIADAVQNEVIPNAKIVGLISNKAKAGAIKLAEERGVPVLLIPSKGIDRAEYEQKLLAHLNFLHPDFICLAGYMLLLGKEVVQNFPGQILNIHPSLLPFFKGLNAQRQALEAGMTETGCTVHFVTEELDDGPIVLQNRVEILAEDSESSLSERLLPIEHETYVQALADLCSRPFRIQDSRVLFE
jgi:phosphoribosylglycinamide formyltransferase 1